VQRLGATTALLKKQSLGVYAWSANLIWLAKNPTIAASWQHKATYSQWATGSSSSAKGARKLLASTSDWQGPVGILVFFCFVRLFSMSASGRI
jgi:hypothetical protein